MLWFHSIPNVKIVDYQIESICRRTNKCCSYDGSVVVKVEYIVRKGENAGITGIFFFPAMF